MKKLQPYFQPVVTLITALVTLGYRVVRQVILPTLSRKGNLLQSIFLFFIGLTEQVITFAETVARVPRTYHIPVRLDNAWAFSRKYFRQGMLIATWALFILSSLEWTSPPTTAIEPISVEQTASAAAPISQSQKAYPAEGNDQVLVITPRITVPQLVDPRGPSTPRWLLLRNFRI